MKKVFKFLNSSLENIFEKESFNIYMDHSAATPLDDKVLKAMHEVESLYSNPSGIYRSGAQVKNKIDESRKIISNILNCQDNEIYFTGSGTESLNLAIIGYVENYLEVNKKDKNENKKPIIVTTNIEHSAVLNPILHLDSKGILEMRYLKVDETGKVRISDLQKILEEDGDRVILVSVMYANNETGRVQPVKEIGRIVDLYNKSAREARAGSSNENKKFENEKVNEKRKISYHIDAMQAGNYLDIDTKKLRAHLMSLNACKIYGPKGVGVLYKNKYTNISPITLGGGQESGLRSGTEDLVKIIGITHALKISQDKKDKEVKRLLILQDYFLEKIKIEIPEVIIYTYKNDVNKIINKNENKINYFNLESLPNNINIGLTGMLSDEMVIRLDYKGFAVSHKSACAAGEIGEGSYVLRAMGATEKESNENIRITMGRSTTKSELDKLVKDIKEVYYKYKTR